ncbi:hypothetical protein NDU88_005892 [Pleurodeles waltl]|uniref:Uncharacterized protein n=1 Tax=Pleurodeles waltl TaxID=8319 RepID=A0AAV7UKK8_PLEWA|nr:hypothetical protein NDU88_005892 [Pleurodeles waltl]
MPRTSYAQRTPRGSPRGGLVSRLSPGPGHQLVAPEREPAVARQSARSLTESIKSGVLQVTTSRSRATPVPSVYGWGRSPGSPLSARYCDAAPEWPGSVDATPPRVGGRAGPCASSPLVQSLTSGPSLDQDAGTPHPQSQLGHWCTKESGVQTVSLLPSPKPSRENKEGAP